MKSTVLVGISGLATLLVCGAGYLAMQKGGPAVASSAAVADTPVVVCSGLIDIDGGVTELTPAAGGEIAEILVHENQQVRAGTVLLRLDDSVARTRLDQARAGLAAAEASFKRTRQEQQLHGLRIEQQRALCQSAQSRLAAAQHMLGHKKEILEVPGISIFEFSVAQEQVKEFEAALRASEKKLQEVERQDPSLMLQEADAEVAAALARVAEADRHLERCKLTAPQDGSVLRILVNVGEMVKSTPAIVFCPTRPYVVRAEIEQEFLAEVTAGQTAQIQDEIYPGKTWMGRVQRIAGWYSQRRSLITEPTQLRDTPTVECLILLDEHHPPLRIGQRVQVRITTDTSKE